MRENIIRAEDGKIFLIKTPESIADLDRLRKEGVGYSNEWEDWLHRRRLAKRDETGDNGNMESEEIKT